MTHARLVIISLVAITAFAFAAPTAAAADPGVGGCGADTVEVCIPTCVQAPCPQYVCVHVEPGSHCLRW